MKLITKHFNKTNASIILILKVHPIPHELFHSLGSFKLLSERYMLHNHYLSLSSATPISHEPLADTQSQLHTLKRTLTYSQWYTFSDTQ